MQGLSTVSRVRRAAKFVGKLTYDSPTRVPRPKALVSVSSACDILLDFANVKFGRPAAGTVHGMSATLIDRVRRLTSSPSTLSGANGVAVSAAAPTIFSTNSVPATPT
jgi:hypothetical protein